MTPCWSYVKREVKPRTRHDGPTLRAAPELRDLRHRQAVRVDTAGQGGRRNDWVFPRGAHPAMVARMREHLGDRAPRWTKVGVTALGEPRVRIGIRVTAIVVDRAEQSVPGKGAHPAPAFTGSRQVAA